MKSRSFTYLSWFTGCCIIAACSSSTPTDDGGTDATTDVGQPNDSAAQHDTYTHDAGSDVNNGMDSSNDSASNDAADSSETSSTMVTLTVLDYLTWCNVNVNAGGVNTASTQTYTFVPDASVSAVGDTANSSLWYWGYWGNVTDAGVLQDGGIDLNKTVTFNITRDMTLLACCPDKGSPLTQCSF